MISSENRLREASKDYKFLLNRGYSRDVALSAVTSRYLLSDKERLAIYRCIHSDSEIMRIKEKEVSLPKEILIDGFNLAISVISISIGEAYLCDDGYIRDLGMGKFKKEKNLLLSSLILVNELCTSITNSCTFVLDAQISKSGEIANVLREIGAKVSLSKTVDSFLITSGKVVATNDFMILMKAKRIINLLKYNLELAIPFFCSRNSA